MSKNENNLTEKDKEDIKNVVEDSIYKEPDETPQEQQYKDLEAIKIVLKEVFEESHLSSTTNLEQDEIEDIGDAEFINLVFNNPLIATKLQAHKQLKRSLTKEPTNLLSALFTLGNRSLIDQTVNPINRILGRQK